MPNTIEINAPAPDFDLPRDGGGSIALKDLKGRKVVLFFYPRDDTPGCTKEAIAFTERAQDFAAVGADILGVSKDNVASHDKFIAKFDLGVALLSDADSDVCERYGVWVEKSLYGKKHMGIERSTFLIDENGLVQGIWRKVKVPGHEEEVLEAVKGL